MKECIRGIEEGFFAVWDGEGRNNNSRLGSNLVSLQRDNLVVT